MMNFAGVGAAGRRESLAAEATRLEKKGELREALQQYQLATAELDMSLKPGLAKHLKDLEQKVFEMAGRCDFNRRILIS